MMNKLSTPFNIKAKLINDFSKICRICMCESTELWSIFESSENIANIVYSLTTIKFKQDDMLPQQICKECSQKATIAFALKTQCEKTDTILRNYLLTSKSLTLKDEPNYFLVKTLKSDSIKEEYTLSTENNSQEGKQTCGSNSFLWENVELSVKNKLAVLKGVENRKCTKCKQSILSCENSLVDHIQFENIFNESDCILCKKCGTLKFELDKLDDNKHISDDNFIHVISQRKRGRPKKVEKLLPEIKVTKEISHECKICNEKFKKKIFLTRHMVTDHADDNNLDKKYDCIECKKAYSSTELLMIHMKSHSDKVYNCSQCSKKFPRLDSFYEHKKRHTGERLFLCNKCGKGFFNQMYLDKHLLIHMNDHLEKPLFECDVCGKILKHRNHLQVHMTTHRDRVIPLTALGSSQNSNKKLILCSVCGKSCSSRSNLAVHMRRHTGQMTNFCEICGKGYPRTTDLALHMRKHTGERPFVCRICQRGFARSDKLAIHMRTHTGEKPYICGICNRGFAQSNDLASHKKRNLCGQSNAIENSSNVTSQTTSIIEATTNRFTDNDGTSDNSSINYVTNFSIPPQNLKLANIGSNYGTVNQICKDIGTSQRCIGGNHLPELFNFADESPSTNCSINQTFLRRKQHCVNSK